MTDNFLTRWSRRKLAKGDEAAPPDKVREQSGDEPVAGEPAKGEAAAPQTTAAAPVDLTSLPSVETIGADTDITGFLRPGVPSDLARAALRKAWTSDPAIRDFVGLVENGWDFNDPNAMGGFGPIDPRDAARLLSQAVGALQQTAAEPPNAPQASPERDGLSDEPQSHPVTSSPADQIASVGEVVEPDSGDVGARTNDAPQKDPA